MPTATATPVATQDPQLIVQNVVKNVGTLATLPEITSQIIATVEDPRSSAGKLHKIISHDPALAARILKVVNSAFYGLPGQIGSVERAIVLLGLNGVKNIAVAASLGQLFRGVKLCDGYSARDLWTHCIGVGVTARELAKLMKQPFADEAFLAGLVHDIGILVELQTWPEQLKAVCTKINTVGGDFCATEREVLGVDHQLLGRALAEHWKFPVPIQMAAGFHHNPETLGDDTRRMLVLLVNAADVIVCKANQGFPLTAKGQELDHNLLNSAGIDAGMLEKATADLAENISGAVSVFS